MRRIGRYTYGHLVAPQIQVALEESDADHIRLDVDERLIDLPWELIHDNDEFLCLKYAVGRRIVPERDRSPSGRVDREPCNA